MMVLYCRLQIKRHHEKTVTGNFSPPLRHSACTFCTGQPLDSNYWWFTGNNLRLRIDYLWNHWSHPGIEKRLTAAFLNEWDEWEKSAKGERHEVRGETSNREQVRMTCGSDVSLEHFSEWVKRMRKNAKEGIRTPELLWDQTLNLAPLTWLGYLRSKSAL